MNRAWRWVLPAYPLLVVNVVVAALYAVVWCQATAWRWDDGVLSFVARRRMLGNPGGQGWSWIVGYASSTDRRYPDLRVHEHTHVVQEFAFALGGAGAAAGALFAGAPVWLVVAVAFGGGPLFALSYGACFLVAFARRGFRDWYSAYRANPFEVHAYGVQDRYLAAAPSTRALMWGHR